MTTIAKYYVSAVVAVFSDCDLVQRAFGELREASIPAEAISIVGTEEDVHSAQLGEFYAPAPVERGEIHEAEATGAKLGVATGLLSGLFTFLVPGLAPFAILGPLAGMLIGAGAGASVGAPLGAVGYQDESIHYRSLLAEGNALLIVHCSTSEDENIARAELNKLHPRQIHTLPYAA
jgi:hypothetical protein